jgi:hypothetical protein
VHDDERAVLAMLCDQLPTLRAEIARHPTAARELLARIEAEARAGQPVRDLLAELLPGDATRQLQPMPLGPGRASEERFACPEGLCDRAATTTPAGPLPRCWLIGRPMKHRSG